MTKEQQGEPEAVEPFIMAPEAYPPRGDLIERIRDLVQENLRPQLVNVTDPITNTPALAIVTGGPDGGIEAVPTAIFDQYLGKPRFRRGNATMLSLDSFIEHVNRFRGEASAIFADDNRQTPKLTAVLDYHPAGADSDPAHGRHRTIFSFPLSDEWRAWQDKNKKPMSMTDFADFLEDRVVDVMSPLDGTIDGDQAKMVETLGGGDRLATPTKLIELSRGLHVYENSVVKESTKLSSGEGEISFEAQHTDSEGRPLIVPTCFLLAIPVFRNDVPYQVLSRLRYRKTPQGLVFWFELWRTDRVFDDAFKRAADRAATETGAPLFLGSPEA